MPYGLIQSGGNKLFVAEYTFKRPHTSQINLARRYGSAAEARMAAWPGEMVIYLDCPAGSYLMNLGRKSKCKV